MPLLSQVLLSPKTLVQSLIYLSCNSSMVPLSKIWYSMFVPLVSCLLFSHQNWSPCRSALKVPKCIICSIPTLVVLPLVAIWGKQLSFRPLTHQTTVPMACTWHSVMLHLLPLHARKLGEDYMTNSSHNTIMEPPEPFLHEGRQLTWRKTWLCRMLE